MPAVEIIRVTDEATARCWHEVDDATRRADQVELPADPLPEVLARFNDDPALGERTELWLLLDSGHPVGAAELSLPTRDNLDLGHIDVRVSPAHRRRGLGGRLLDHLADRARAADRKRAVLQSGEPLTGGAQAPGPAFLRARGAAPVLSQLRRLLRLDDLPDERLAELRARAAAHATDYELVQWVDRAPAADAAGLAELHVRMALDVPTEDLDLEPEVWDVARVRANEEHLLARGRCIVVTAARHRASGRLVGYTDITASRSHPRVGYQFDTLVEPDHRGHRLGLLMKAANLEQLRTHLPGTTLLNTWNAEVNAPMVAINDVLGFRPVDRWRDWELAL